LYGADIVSDDIEAGDCQELRVCEAVIRKAGTAVLAGKDH
jgi:hypothetical protein